ncbi:MAG: methionine adenosyltransferase [Oscillospiraceae bacterium]|nr:methionine adenosyltransferase [Oscillospiraceae bacterium]
MMSRYIFTSESVTEGHPDKVADRISDSILDAYLAKDPAARVAAETVIKNNTVILAGEISSSAEIDTEKVVRDAINDIGYNSEELGFDGHSAEIINLLDRQSPDIAQGVDSALEVREENGDEIGAGDQGIIFGYAVNETPELLPLPISLAHRLSHRLAEVRKNGTLPYLRPDGKTQVSVIYEDGNAVGIDTILVSTQHDEEVTQDKLRADLIKNVIVPVIPKKWLTGDVRILVNPTGRFVIGGPVGDSGLTGRKIIVDTYGGAAHHGGGAFSGKDSTKVDRSAAYAARWAAKNIVAAGLAKRAEIQLAYAIGVAAPVSVYVNTFGTGVITDEEIQAAVTEIFDFTPGGIIRDLDLRKPVFAATSAYGHFGRPDADFTWERTNKAEELKNAVRKVTKYAG